MPQIMSPILVCHMYYHLRLCVLQIMSPILVCTCIITKGRLCVPQIMSPILVCQIYYHLRKTGCATNHVTHLGLPHVLSPKTVCATNHVTHLGLHMHYHQRKIVFATNHVTHLGLPHISSPKEEWLCHKSRHSSWFATCIIT